jgi:hypothetical protein
MKKEQISDKSTENQVTSQWLISEIIRIDHKQAEVDRMLEGDFKTLKQNELKMESLNPWKRKYVRFVTEELQKVIHKVNSHVNIKDSLKSTLDYESKLLDIAIPNLRDNSDKPLQSDLNFLPHGAQLIGFVINDLVERVGERQDLQKSFDDFPLDIINFIESGKISRHEWFSVPILCGGILSQGGNEFGQNFEPGGAFAKIQEWQERSKAPVAATT